MTMLNQNFAVWSGNTHRITVFVTEDDDVTPKDLTDASITWFVRAPGSTTNILEKTTVDGGLWIVDPPTDGKFVIALDPPDTVDLAGTYYHQADLNIAGEVSTVMVGSMMVNQIALVPDAEEGITVSGEISVVGSNIYITLQETLIANYTYTVKASKGLKDVYGNALQDDYLLNFTSLYNPLTGSTNTVEMDLLQYMTSINADHMFRYMRENTMSIQRLTPRRNINWEDPPFEFKQYVRHKTIYDMVLNAYVKATGGSGKSVKLGQLHIDKKSASQDMAVILRRLQDNLQPWYDLCMAMTNRGRAKTTSISKSERKNEYDGTYPYPREIR